MSNIKDVKIGDTIKIICLKDDDGIPDPAAERYKGLTGKVTHKDDAGQLHGTWGSLAILDVDSFEIINTKV